ncbi:MAG TPA: cytochrome b N-terminal domain-containing protein, partial [Candidatus Baltobacteraceae bacterium]
MASLITWLEQRTGLVSTIDDFLTEDVPGGASYWYVFGSATLFAMILQIVTGIFLTFYYAPSAASAWESTKYIYEHVPLGEFVISLHYWGATAMIALVFLHLLQVLIWGAYKAPRELGWVVGVLLLVITMVLGLTGYLLPWDLNAYFASAVAINIAASVPVIGPAVFQFLAGGDSLGTLTINRFFGLHVWLMPALLVVLVVLHLMIFRHNGGAGPPTDEDTKKLPQGRFWPDQMFMDAVASFAVFAVIVALSIFSPPGLDQKADPTRQFTPYPAWYFLALYGLLRIVAIFPHDLAPIANLFATVIIPGALVTVLILLPFLDRNPSRRIARRPWIMGITAVSIIAAVGLSIFSQMAILQEVASAAALPQQPPAAASSGGSQTTAAAPADKGAAVFATNCSGCHGAAGQGTPGAFPPLAKNPYVTGNPKQVVHTVLYGLTGAIAVNGATYNGQMPPWKGQLSNADIADVITYVRSSWGNNASKVAEKDVAA